MNHLRSNVKFIIWSGFGAVIALMLVLGAVMVFKLNQQTVLFKNVVKVSNTKVSLVHAMRDDVRLRSLSLNKMALSDDIFFRDDEKLNFFIYANRFITAFENFKQFNLNETELKLTNSVQEKINIGYPLNQKALDMLLNYDEIDAIKPIIVDALGAQEQILKKLDELITLQKLYSEASVKVTEKKMNDILTVLILVVSIAIIFSIIVSQTVSKIVSQKNTEIAKATEIKSMFLANMSHEIRTPLTAIIGFAKSQMIPDLPKDHNERATKIILRNSEHLLTIINDILDFSKIEANKLEYDFVEFSLFNLLEDVQSSLTGLIGDKALKFNINFNYPLPDKITTDQTRLHQILINLGGNAIKFTEEGLINIDVRYNNKDDEVYFDINDSGIGMTEEQQEMVFQTFSQADITTTRQYGGTGLGLSISSELVNNLGGKLTLVSEPGVGSTFSFKIKNKIDDLDCKAKLVNCHPGESDLKQANIKIKEKELIHGSILLVEDIVDNQKLITFYLEEMGVAVTIASNGKEAVEITKNKVFDLVLMDMQMPVMGGVEAIRLIRKRGDKYPIVMLTANTAKEYKQECLDVGCDDFLLKPLNENALLEVVKKYLREIKPVEISQTDNEIKHLTNNTSDKNTDIIFSTLLDNNEKKFDKFISRFINYLPTYVDEISEYIKIKNDNELKIVTHKLKGVGGNMGFKILTDISENLEIAIAQGNRNEIARLFDELKAVAKKIYRGNEKVSKNLTA